jgi:hypothetical protein
VQGSARSAGAAHLAAIARAPRAAGSEAEREAREYCAGVLRAAGFDVIEERFEYSRLPGCWGTPIGGAIAALTVLGAGWLATVHLAPRAAAVTLLGGLAMLGAWAARMLGDGVLDVPFMRASAVNLVATAGPRRPPVWLVAHLDTKSQPVPSALRVAGVLLLAAAVLVALVALALTLAAATPRMWWWIGAALAVAGSVPVVSSTVGDASPGAVDDASGVAAVLAAAEALGGRARVGVVLTSAEELGLAGARAWARARAGEEGVALNCDGVDDEGALTIMYSGSVPTDVVQAIREGAERAPRLRRMPIGLLLDSVALSAAGWRSVTASRGSLATLRRVHTPSDSLDRLRGDAIPEVAGVLAHAAEVLAR